MRCFYFKSPKYWKITLLRITPVLYYAASKFGIIYSNGGHIGFNYTPTSLRAEHTHCLLSRSKSIYMSTCLWCSCVYSPGRTSCMSSWLHHYSSHMARAVYLTVNNHTFTDYNMVARAMQRFTAAWGKGHIAGGPLALYGPINHVVICLLYRQSQNFFSSNNFNRQNNFKQYIFSNKIFFIGH